MVEATEAPRPRHRLDRLPLRMEAEVETELHDPPPTERELVQRGGLRRRLRRRLFEKEVPPGLEHRRGERGVGGRRRCDDGGDAPGQPLLEPVHEAQPGIGRPAPRVRVEAQCLHAEPRQRRQVHSPEGAAADEEQPCHRGQRRPAGAAGQAMP